MFSNFFLNEPFQKNKMEVVKYQFASDEIVDIPIHFSHYEYNDIIGQGTYAVVIKAIDLKKGNFVACKLSFRKFLENPVILNKFERELRIHKRLNHPNIAKIIDVIYLKDVIITVMDYYKQGDLLSIVSKMVLHEYEVMEISKKLIDALCYLHERDIVHRDIKPENIVFDTRRNPVLIDFGLSNEQNHDASTTICGTMLYMSPELLLNKEYDAKKADIWALGITIYVIATRTYPFTSDNPRTMLREMRTLEENLKESGGNKICLLLSQMLAFDPNQRKTAEELKKTFCDKPHKNVLQSTKRIGSISIVPPVLSGQVQAKGGTFIVRIPSQQIHRSFLNRVNQRKIHT